MLEYKETVVRDFVRTSPLYITRPVQPDMQIFIDLCNRLNETRVYSNFAEVEQRLSKALKTRWGSPDLLLFNNCTTALFTGMLALPRKGVIVTTPFSFPATAHAAKLAGFDIRFCDIEPETLNIDPDAVLATIDDDTVGVLGVHVFGNPCNVRAIGDICAFHGLYEIYDAAHCVDVFMDDRSLFHHGLFSVVSLHATKLLHCGEGGALFSRNSDFMAAVKLLMNFGIVKEDVLDSVGLNGKMSEFNAAVGLSVMPRVAEEISARACVAAQYYEGLSRVSGVSFPRFPDNLVRNHQYFPIILSDNSNYKRDLVQLKLKEKNIHCRKYFFPLLSNCRAYKACSPRPMPTAERIANQILCLPIHSGVTEEDINCICAEITAVMSHG